MTNNKVLDALRSICQENLRLKRDETYLFFTDVNSRWEDGQEVIQSRREYLHTLYEAFLSLSNEWPRALHDKYESTRRHGAEPRENIWRHAFGERIYSKLVKMDILWRLREGADISDDEVQVLNNILQTHPADIVDCVIAFPWYSSTHTRFRRLLNQQGCRYVSMPMITQSVMEGPMQADWADVKARTERVYEILIAAKYLSLSCKQGTKLNIEVGERKSIHKDTGDFSRPGSFGNMPAGESYLVPKLGTTNGQLVFTSGPDKPVIEPTCAIIESGRISGFDRMTEYARELDAKFDCDFEMRHIAELGIGTNPLARDVSSMIEGEKICGTVHVAIGSDRAIGGSVEASEHLDHIIVSPTLKAQMNDGSTLTIVDNGQLLV